MHIPPVHTVFSWLEPEQGFPPWAGAELSHFLDLECVQLLSHVDHCVQFPQFPSIGRHLSPIHVSVSLPKPRQSLPPLAGAGASHLLVLDLTHLLPHSDHGDQVPQTPWMIHLPSVQDSDSSPEPGQEFPPFLGAGLSHFLDLVFVQLLSQDDQDPQFPQIPSTTHCPSIQDSVSLPEPKQGFPPFWGAGFLHFLSLSFVQLLIHDDHEDQIAQFPSRTHCPSVQDSVS